MAGAALRRLVRLPAILALLFGALLAVLVAFPFSGERRRRAATRVWSRWLCGCCGIALSELAAPAARRLSELPAGRMIVANHISWLDIFAINAFCPAAFVAKAEIARWPLLGTLVSRTGTMFLERGKRHAVHRIVEHVERSLKAGARVAVFPEGTTGDGGRLLPFHANLIQAAILGGAPVVPVGLRYVDGRAAPPAALEYVGDTSLLTSLWRITGATGIRCELITLAEIAPVPGATRHDVAQRARGDLAHALGLPLDDALPEKLRELRRSAA